MWRTTLRSLLSHKLRLALSGLSIVLGVAFVVGTMVFTDTLSRTFRDLFEVTSSDVNVAARPAFDVGSTNPGAAAEATVAESVVAELTTVQGVERTREIGLLRAVGMARGQVRRMIRLESVVISLYGAALGLVLGTVLGVALTRALAGQGITVLSVPYGRLLLFLALAGVVGVLAALWPARRAARLHVLDAIATA